MRTRYLLIPLMAATLLAGCGGGDDSNSGQPVSQRSGKSANGSSGLGRDARAIARARDLTPDDVTAALKTYMPSGRFDDYIMFASGGHSGQVLMIGVPSMRLLRVIAVFTPEPGQGWG